MNLVDIAVVPIFPHFADGTYENGEPIFDGHVAARSVGQTPFAIKATFAYSAFCALLFEVGHGVPAK